MGSKLRAPFAKSRVLLFGAWNAQWLAQDEFVGQPM
jgi:hypothetical protein